MSETFTTLWIDAATGISEVKEYTTDEIADSESLQEQAQVALAARAAQAAARESALAKLADLGLTAEEIAAL